MERISIPSCSGTNRSQGPRDGSVRNRHTTTQTLPDPQKGWWNLGVHDRQLADDSGYRAVHHHKATRHARVQMALPWQATLTTCP